MHAVAARIHKRSRRERIDPTILASNVEQHQLGVVLELNAQPVPPHLLGLQLMSEEFVIHPRRARNLKLCAAQIDFTPSIYPGKRNVMRRASRPFRLFADTA